jgi:hypothetical protein
VEGSLYTDPMSFGIINSIDFHLDDCWVRSVNIYFLCNKLPTGYATMHSRIKRYQRRPSSPLWLKRLTIKEFLEYLTSERISKVRITDWMVLVQGDFNRPLQFNTNPTQLETWMTINRLTSPDFEHLRPLSDYHMFNSGGDRSLNAHHSLCRCVTGGVGCSEHGKEEEILRPPARDGSVLLSPVR